MSRPLDELRAISTAWGTLTRDSSPTQNDLAIAVYHTMVDPSGIRGIWENLDVEERAFISWLLNQRNMRNVIGLPICAVRSALAACGAEVLPYPFGGYCEHCHLTTG